MSFMRPQEVFGPAKFENIDHLLAFVCDQVLRYTPEDPVNEDLESAKKHPLQTAIAEHISKQIILTAEPRTQEIIEGFTRTSGLSLRKAFREKSGPRGKEPHKFIAHSFWDSLRKDSGGLRIALDKDLVELKDTMLDPETKPTHKPHTKMVAMLRSNLYFFKKHFDKGPDTPEHERFNAALDYMKNTLLPEMERLLEEAFPAVTKGKKRRLSFADDYIKAAKALVEQAKVEHLPAQGPPATPGRRLGYPLNLGYDGFRPTAESLGL